MFIAAQGPSSSTTGPFNTMKGQTQSKPERQSWGITKIKPLSLFHEVQEPMKKMGVWRWGADRTDIFNPRAPVEKERWRIVRSSPAVYLEVPCPMRDPASSKKGGGRNRHPMPTWCGSFEWEEVLLGSSWAYLRVLKSRWLIIKRHQSH